MAKVLTARDLEIIKETWNLIAQDMKHHGSVFFLRLFEKYPPVQLLFEKIKDTPYDQLADNEFFQFHAFRVMETIDLAVNSIGDMANLQIVLKELGLSHAQYKVKSEHFELVGLSLIYAIEQALGKKFTNEVKTAWVRLYGLVEENMSKGLQDN